MNGAPSSMVSPGLWGFLAFFVLALALYLLMRNMNARMRRMSYRAEELQREAEAQEAERTRVRRGEGDRHQPPQDDREPDAGPQAQGHDAVDSGDDAVGPQGQTEDPTR